MQPCFCVNFTILQEPSYQHGGLRSNQLWLNLQCNTEHQHFCLQKVQRLQDRLHFADEAVQAQHTVFVDDEEELRGFPDAELATVTSESEGEKSQSEGERSEQVTIDSLEGRQKRKLERCRFWACCCTHQPCGDLQTLTCKEYTSLSCKNHGIDQQMPFTFWLLQSIGL